MNDYENITEWPTYSDASRKQRQALLARKQQEPLRKAIAIAILAGRIMGCGGGADAIYSATKIVA